MPRTLVLRNAVLSRRGFTGVVLKYGNVKLCIDPGDAFDDCMYILCTHEHRRHCSENTRILSREKLASPYAGRIVKPGEMINLGDVKIKVVEAYNEPDLYGGMPPHPRGLGVGYVIEFPNGLTIYYVGDSSLVPEVVKAAENVYALFTPIGGGCVMTPEEAAELVKSARPSITIPMHFEDPEDYYKFRDISQPYTQIIFLGRV